MGGFHSALRWVDEKAAALTAKLDHVGVGAWVRAVFFVVPVLWPLALDSELVSSPRAKAIGFGVFLLVFLLGAALQRHRFTAASRHLEAELGRINGSFSGAIHSLANEIHPIRGPLSEERCKDLCRTFLSRAKDFAHLAFPAAKEGVRLRATLALPIVENGQVVCLRVWCYDQMYKNRRWSVLPLDWPGAPEAFCSGHVRIISDIEAVGFLPPQEARGFKSAVCFPILALPGGQPLGVMCLDASNVNFFTPADADRLYAYVGPSIEALGIVLQLRKSHAPVHFR